MQAVLEVSPSPLEGELTGSSWHLRYRPYAQCAQKNQATWLDYCSDCGFGFQNPRLGEGHPDRKPSGQPSQGGLGVYTLQTASCLPCICTASYQGNFQETRRLPHSSLIGAAATWNNSIVPSTKSCRKYILRFNGNFPGGPGLAGTRVSPFRILLELRMMEVVVTTGAISRAKLQSNHHHQRTNIQYFTSRMSFLSPNQQCQSSEGNKNIASKYRTAWRSGSFIPGCHGNSPMNECICSSVEVIQWLVIGGEITCRRWYHQVL